MWRSVVVARAAVSSRQGGAVWKRFYATQNLKSKVPSSKTHTQAQSDFSTKWGFSKRSYLCLNPRFFSQTSTNPTDFELSSVGIVEDIETQLVDSEIDGVGVQDLVSSDENRDTQLDGFVPGDGDEVFGVSEQSGDAQFDSIATGDENSDAQMDNFPAGDGDGEGEVYEINVEHLENVLSLLQSSVDGSLESDLDDMGLTLHEEFVVKVLETPLVLGENLIRFFKWAIKEETQIEGEKENGLLNVEILNELIALFSKLGKGKAGLEMLDEGCLPENEKVGKIISWFCKGNKAKDAHSVYLLAKEKNHTLPRSSVNFLISSLCRKDETVTLALEMLDDFSGEARKYAIKPFSTVIHGLCRMKDVDGAKQLLSKMIAEGPPPGNAVFNSIISGYSKAGDLGEAMQIKKLMESRGLKPDVYTYTVIMSGYTNGGQMEEACKVLAEAKKKHSKLTPVTYHTLIRGYCKLEEFDKALKLLSEMKDFGVQPNVDEYNKLIQSLCLKALDWETAETLLEEMKEKGLHLNGITQGLIRAVKEMEEEELVLGS
uniref:Pentacotripeptide-repeat region of PRORP domain-containing protein n=1 Tax=Fagus sylvatica TaxID=28930 RepID=A0A2N9I4P6_FAGSY